MKLVVAIIVTGVTLTVAMAGYGLIAMNSRVVSKYERSAIVNTLRFRIKEQVACRSSQNFVCEAGNAALSFKTPLEQADKFRFVRNRNLSSSTGTKGLQTVLSTTCTSNGSLNLDYILLRDGQPALDPVSRKPSQWKSLYGTPVCVRGALTAKWP